jgi:hypothetical protein
MPMANKSWDRKDAARKSNAAGLMKQAHYIKPLEFWKLAHIICGAVWGAYEG